MLAGRTYETDGTPTFLLPVAGQQRYMVFHFISLSRSLPGRFTASLLLRVSVLNARGKRREKKKIEKH